ncbi:type-F conjugative transfer system pilin assembly protein TrbC [Legionella sainthelensi]|uniref:Type-F conjugative transfer system pilin assembly protein TrbC n=1 Tax=Legionella sainthelensi TaxID=28087 RepID=A0A2H5FRP5_9GAMM|nr:type-F conjugative transfer system pilin assembly protein TrbC [Legionella sainthelensi]AUH74238.1 type-F conjugative transfer system pilin assembly protein TrbC [Legionella sainthelensi]
MNAFGIFLSSLFLVTSSHANVNDFLNEASVIGKTAHDSVSQDTLAHWNAASNQSIARNKTLIDQIIEQSRQGTPVAQKGQSVDGAVLFVSFSMPESLLFSLSDEAASYKIPVVINGLIEGDFKKTITAFSKLHAKAKESKWSFNGVSVDPLWFEQFHITAVPALVVSKRPSSCGQQLICPEQTYDVVYGNASIKKSLQLIAQKGDSANEVAQALLENAHA